MNRETLNRFWAKVDKHGPVPSHRPRLGRCWIWKASKRAKGYGAFVWASKDGTIIQGRSHRFSWELENGKLDPSTCILHHCDNPPCVRPSHLFQGTRAINNFDMHAKGRNVAGGTYCGDAAKYERAEQHHNAKFTWCIIGQMRNDRKNGMSFGQLAKKYHTTISNVFKIVKGKAWKKI